MPIIFLMEVISLPLGAVDVISLVILILRKDGNYITYVLFLVM